MEPQRWWLSLAVAAAALVVLRARVPARRPGRAGAVALAGAGGWAAWSLASVLWAADPAWAWTAAGRAGLAAAVLALVVCWPGTAGPAVRARLAATVVVGVAAAQAAAAWAGALDGALEADGRLRGGLPYANAFAMLAVAGGLAALGLAAGARDRRARAGWTAAGAVLLATALAAQSRSSLPALVAGLCAAAALAPRPWRALVVPAVAALAAAGAAAPAVLAVRTAALDGEAGGAVGRALAVVTVAAVAAGLLAALVGGAPGRGAAGRARHALLLLAAVAAAGAPVVAALAADAPDYTRIESSTTRFAAGASSNRPDMWRVALDVARDHPLRGVGAGSFGRPYLRERHSTVAPRFAHSVVAEPLATLGLPGVALVLALFGGLLAGALGRRARTPAAIGLIAAGVAVLAQALVDWSTELPVLGLVLLLALAACHDPGGAPLLRRTTAPLAGAAVVLTLLLVPAAVAGRLASTPTLDRLDAAARVWPLDARPLQSRAFVALRAGRPDIARDAADRALARDPDGWLAPWLRAAIDVQDGRFRAALALLRRAAAANPGERAVAKTRSAALRGERVAVLEAARRVLGDGR